MQKQTKTSKISRKKLRNQNKEKTKCLQFDLYAQKYFVRFQNKKQKINIENGTVCFKDAVFIENQIIVSIDIKIP